MNPTVPLLTPGKERIKQIVDAALINKKSALIEIRKGEFIERKGLRKMISTSGASAVVMITGIVFFFLLINEIFQLVKLKGRTPLGWLTHWCGPKA